MDALFNVSFNFCFSFINGSWYECTIILKLENNIRLIYVGIGYVYGLISFSSFEQNVSMVML